MEPCWKHTFDSEREAKAFNRSYHKGGRSGLRPYRCTEPGCGKWHLTSKDPKPRRKAA